MDDGYVVGFNQDNPTESEARKLIGNTLNQITETKITDYEYAEKWVKIGISIHNDGKLSAREYATITGTSYDKIRLSVKLAKKCNYDIEKFKDLWYATNSKTLYGFARKVIPSKTPRISDAASDLHRKVFALLESGTITYEQLRELKSARNLIDRHIPRQEEFMDKDYLRYNSCACCGKYPPPEKGYDLLKYGDRDYILYPACNLCKSQNKQPNLDLLLDMYAVYAHNIEDAYNFIQENL